MAHANAGNVSCIVAHAQVIEPQQGIKVETDEAVNSFLLAPAGFLAKTVNDQALQPPSAFILSIVVFASSYLLAFTAVFMTKSCLFHFDAIYLPMLVSSILGLTNLVVDLGIYNWLQMNTNIITSLTLAMLSIPCWTFFSLLSFRKIYLVRKTDGLPRQEAKVRTFTMPETELQRQNLLKLLLSPENARPDKSEGSSEATYKIYWPGFSRGHTRQNTIGTLKGRFHSSRQESNQHSPHSQTYCDKVNAQFPPPLCEAPGPTPRIGGIELGIPTLIPEETTTTKSPPFSSSTTFSPPRIQDRRHKSTFSTVTGERVPSYHSRSSPYIRNSPSTLESTPPLPVGPNGFPIEKVKSPESSEGPSDRESPRRNPMDNYKVIEDEAAVRRQIELSKSNSRGDKA